MFANASLNVVDMPWTVKKKIGRKKEKFMEKYVEFTLQDGSKIIIETDELALGNVNAGRRIMNKVAEGEFSQGELSPHRKPH